MRAQAEVRSARRSGHAEAGSGQTDPWLDELSTRRARLSRDQARSSTDYSRPRRRAGPMDRGVARNFWVGMSIVSCSRTVTYGPRCVLAARTSMGGSRSAVL
jgi:hypothetical protein